MDKTKKTILFALIILGELPLLCISWLLLIEDGSNPVTMIPLIGLGLWVLIIIILPFYAIGRAAKESKKKKLAASMVKQTGKESVSMYKAKGVIFEYENLISIRYSIGMALGMLFPFILLTLLYLDDRLKNASESIHTIIMVTFILGLILWLPICIIGAICFRNMIRKVFRYFPKCPQSFRHDVSAEFDFTSKPGSVSCKIKSMYERSGFKTIQGIKYDETYKILVFHWLSYFMESRRLRGKYRHTESAYVVIPAPYSEKLVNLLRENHITDIQPFDPELAKYCYQSVNIS